MIVIKQLPNPIRFVRFISPPYKSMLAGEGRNIGYRCPYEFIYLPLTCSSDQN